MKIEKSEALGRNIRRGEGAALSESTWNAVRQAIRDGKLEDALAGIDYGCSETKAMHDSACSFVDDALAHIARSAGEEKVYELLRARYEPVVDRWLATTPGVQESLERGVEFQRGHSGETSIREEESRFVVTCNPCGSGGQLRRTKKVAKAQHPHNWTWNQAGVPYYCTHCAVMWEILPIEKRGYPIRVTLPPERDTDPCVHLYYKNPEAVPQEYLSRTSRTRDPGTARNVEAPVASPPPTGRASQH